MPIDERYWCPLCKNMKDTPNHEIGCVGGEDMAVYKTNTIVDNGYQWPVANETQTVKTVTTREFDEAGNVVKETVETTTTTTAPRGYTNPYQPYTVWSRTMNFTAP